MRIKVLILFSIIYWPLKGQTERFKTGETSLSINSIGQTSLQDTAIIYPLNSSNIALRNINFWVTGISPTLDTLAIGSDVFSNRNDWVSGPAHTSGSQYISSWPGIWRINQNQIESHKNNFNNSGYVVPQNIASWPSNIQQSGFPKIVSSFVDYDLNGSYDPVKGDFPYVLGVNNVIAVATDSFAKGNFKMSPFPMDLTFQYFVLDSLLNRYYCRATLCNRSNVNYQDVRLSSVLYGQIGNTKDDAMLTDINGNLVAIKNGQFTDQNYGTNWPALGFMFCNKKLAASIYIKNSMSKVFGKPETATEFYNYAHSKWLEGKSLTYGGSGVDGTIPVSYAYTGYSDTSNSKAVWNDDQDIGKRTVVASSESLSINAGKCEVIDFCIFIIPDAPSDSLILAEGKDVLKSYNAKDFNLGLRSHNKSQKRVPTLFVKRGQSIQVAGFKKANVYGLDGRLIEQSLQAPANPGIYLLISETDAQVIRLIVE